METNLRIYLEFSQLGGTITCRVEKVAVFTHTHTYTYIHTHTCMHARIETDEHEHFCI